MEHSYQSQILDHLGLVAAMFDELELGPLIDRRIKQDREARTLSIGQAVKAMVLNGLGFVNQRLYLVPRFFETKPTERLLGPGIRPEHVNDDTLGRALDSLYGAGLTELFRDLAAHAAAKLGLSPRFAHLDATSFHVDGRYNSDEDAVEEGVIHIRQGYSRDHRPELNQVVLALMVEQRAGLPILMQPLAEGYRALAHRSHYGGVAQRWLVGHSEAAQKRAQSGTKKHLARKHAAESKAFKKLQRQVFSCRADAEQALLVFDASLVASRVEAGHILECEHVTLEEATEARSYRIGRIRCFWPRRCF